MPDTRTRILAALALALALQTGPTPAVAWSEPPVAAAALDQLETEGYGIVSVRRSWFGRIVILADRDGVLREIVLNRATGAVLSDRTFSRGAGQTSAGPPAGQRQGAHGGDRGSDAASGGSKGGN